MAFSTVYDGTQLEDAVSAPPERNAAFPNYFGSFLMKSACNKNKNPANAKNRWNVPTFKPILKGFSK